MDASLFQISNKMYYSFYCELNLKIDGEAFTNCNSYAGVSMLIAAVVLSKCRALQESG